MSACHWNTDPDARPVPRCSTPAEYDIAIVGVVMPHDGVFPVCGPHFAAALEWAADTYGETHVTWNYSDGAAVGAVVKS